MPTFYFDNTSKPRLNCLNIVINFLWNFIPLFCNGFQRIKISYPLTSVYIFLPQPQDLKPAEPISGLFGSNWCCSSNHFFFFFLSFNISRMSLAVWSLVPSCINKYSLSFASFFISGFIFLESSYNYTSFLPLYLDQQRICKTLVAFVIDTETITRVRKASILQFSSIVFPLAPLVSSYCMKYNPHRYATYRVVSP